MSGRGMARADFVAGLAFTALGLAVVVESLRMPRFAELNVEPYTAPGLVPGVLGLVILGLGGVLCLRAVREGGWRLTAGRPRGRSSSSEPGAGRLVLAVALCLAYAAGLVGTVPFWLATFLFIAAFVILFEWPLARSRADRLRRLAFALLLAAVIAAAVTVLFQEVFLVRLP
jgi:putative tricarboxylic transport membrane protein